jgi:hypothetical protein
VLDLGSVATVASNFILLTPFTRFAVYKQDALSLAWIATNGPAKERVWEERLLVQKGLVFIPTLSVN